MAKAGLPSGTRDFLPEKLIFRQKVIATIKEVFERYGFLPLETPAMERLDVLSGKYGEEADKLIFKILKRGDELKEAIAKGEELADMGLRYDLTVPLCRVIAMYQNEIDFPFRRYQIQPVWRAERAQKGRYREFYQCDVDVVGQAAPLPDAELIALTYEVLKELQFFPGSSIRVNHRQILSVLADWADIPPEKQLRFFSSLDKFDKIGPSRVKDEMIERGFSNDSVHRVMSLIEANSLDNLSKTFDSSEKGRRAIEEMDLLLNYVKKLGVPNEAVSFDLSLARGLDYYTGPIFETVLHPVEIGSLTGGGRYDNLVGSFTGKNIPATGTSFGLERIIDILIAKDEGTIGGLLARTQILVIPFDFDTVPYALEVATFLRREKVRTTVYPFPLDKMRDKFAWTSKRKNRFVAVVGPDEIANREITYKDMTTGQQEKKKFGELPTGLDRGE